MKKITAQEYVSLMHRWNILSDRQSFFDKRETKIQKFLKAEPIKVFSDDPMETGNLFRSWESAGRTSLIFQVHRELEVIREILKESRKELQEIGKKLKEYQQGNPLPHPPANGHRSAPPSKKSPLKKHTPLGK